MGSTWILPARREKNVLTVIKKTIAIIETEQKIIQWELQQSSLLNKKSISVNAKLQWSGTIADLVEFAYGVLETKKVNAGEIDIVELVDKLGTFFSVEINDCYDM